MHDVKQTKNNNVNLVIFKLELRGENVLHKKKEMLLAIPCRLNSTIILGEEKYNKNSTIT